MSKINIIQNAIKELEGGSFQKLFDAYLYKKYKFTNIQTLGVQEGTNKTTMGTPDSFVVEEDGKYILIMYGTVGMKAFDKIKKDLLSCFDKDKVQIDESKIKKIICAYSSTNIHIDQQEELRQIISGISIEMIGLSTISHDLLVNYPFLAAEYLNIQVDTHQIFSINEFIEVYDKNGMNAPLDMDLCCREKEKEKLYTAIMSSKITLVTGGSGVGKTRLVIEVCKQFERNGWNVLCVRNNGELLYNDMQYYTSDEGKYILFIDDANQTTSLGYVLDYINGRSNNIVIKVVMTVRDYARHRIKEIICRYRIPEEMAINVLKEEEIKTILKSNLGILNEDYLDRIAQIAKGNPRLAILAGKISIENGYLAIRNATDIFAHYYGRIIENAELSADEINALFVISFLGAIKYKENETALKIMELVGINSECFTELCHNLNEKELIDLYHDEIAKVSDQSLGNYILEYVLIEKKIILISQLLQIAFPRFRNKVVYVINTLIRLFYSEEMRKYIESQVNISWSAAEEEKQDEYLYCFHSLNKEKTLAVIKQKIDNTEGVEMDVTSLDIEGKKNNIRIECDEIAVLSSFKYSEYFEDAMELLLRYFEKRPDLIMDVYFAFSDRMSVDKSSYKFDYAKERMIIDCLWQHADHGKNRNVTILLLHVLDKMLKCSFHKTESGNDGRTVSMFNFSIIFTDGSKKMRFMIWQILSDLYSNETYMKQVSDIVAVSHVSGLPSDDARRFFEYDLHCEKELFFSKWEKPSFEQCKIIRELEKHSEWLEIKDDDLFKVYADNNDFVIYNTLVKEHMRGRTWEEDEAERKREIKEMTKEYRDGDYSHLFEICRECEENRDKEAWSLRSGLDIVFSLIESTPEIYYKVIELYLKYKAPYGYDSDRIINTLLKNFGLEETKKLVDKYEFSYKHNWISAIWKNIPKNLVDSEITKEFYEFVKQEATLDNPDLPPVIYLEKYQVIDCKIIGKVSSIVIDCSLKNRHLAAEFLGGRYQDSTVELLMGLFADDWEMLENLYLCAIGEHFDYNGKLLIKLIEKNFSFWGKFTCKIAGNRHRDIYEHKVFESIWEMDDYVNLVQVAWDNILCDAYGFMIEDRGAVIFANSQDTSDSIKQRKMQWIKSYIGKHLEDVHNLQTVFEVIAIFFPSERKVFLLELINYTKDIELFKKIPLFPSSASWSGSEVPLIDKKIEFLSSLIISFKGVELIEHRAYLKEMKESYECYKQNVLVREYLENSDIA